MIVIEKQCYTIITVISIKFIIIIIKVNSIWANYNTRILQWIFGQW